MTVDLRYFKLNTASVHTAIKNRHYIERTISTSPAIVTIDFNHFFRRLYIEIVTYFTFFLLIFLFQLSASLETNSDILIPISFKPNVVDLKYFKL